MATEFVLNNGAKGLKTGYLYARYSDPRKPRIGETTVDKIETATNKITLTAEITGLAVGDLLHIFENGDQYNGIYVVQAIDTAKKVITVSTSLFQGTNVETFTGNKPKIGKLETTKFSTLKEFKTEDQSYDTETIYTLDSTSPTTITKRKEYGDVELTYIYHPENEDVKLLEYCFDNALPFVVQFFEDLTQYSGRVYYGKGKSMDGQTYKAGTDDQDERKFVLTHDQNPIKFNLKPK